MKLNYYFKNSLKEKRYKRLDIIVSVSLLVLIISSCFMVYSASMIGNTYGIFTNFVPVEPNYFLKKQLVWGILSFISYLLFATIIPYEIFKNKKFYTRGLFIIGALLLLPHLQSGINGAKSWLRIGSFSFQTSVLAQIFLIAYLALILNSRRMYLMRPTTLQNLVGIFAIPLGILLLIFIQNDTGTMLITGMVVIIIVLCSNISFRNILSLLKVGIISVISLALFLILKSFMFSSGKSYQADRFRTFFDPFYGTEDPNNQIVNSLIAFGNGGLTGRGLLNSIQKLGYLSEAHTDFILAITAEEVGFLGILGLIVLLTIIIIKVIYTGLKSDNTFDSLFSLGFASLIAVQTIVNIGGITASLPMTGVPIPFFSYGGSSMLILSTTLGIVMNLLSSINYKKGSN